MKTIKILTLAVLTAGTALPAPSHAGDDSGRVLLRILENQAGYRVLRDVHYGPRHVFRVHRRHDDGVSRGKRAIHRDDDDDDGRRRRNDDDD